MTLGLDTLRAKTLAIIAVLVVAPVVFVWLTSPFEDALGGDMRNDLRYARDQAGDLARMQAPSSDYSEIAERFRVWIRVLRPDTGETMVSADGTKPSLRERLLFAPDPVPSVVVWDEEVRPALIERAEVQAAISDGEAGACNSARAERMLVCYAVGRVSSPGKPPVIMYLTKSYGRGTTGLYDERWQVAKLMLVVLTMASVLGLWLASRITKPLQSLRDQVLERTRPPVSTRPVEPVGDRDFTELGEAFNELLGALDERRRANERFMADIAHEIKNPVAAVRAAAESLARGEEVSAGRAERLANILRDSSRRLDHVVTNFLELARAESGLPEVPRDHVQLGKLVENATKSYRDDERYAELELLVACDDVWVPGSAEHLERAVRNLVENALSFAQKRVQVRVRRHGDLVEVSVRDDGRGILPEDVDRVFDRFFTRRDDGGGTGLGLAMTRAIVAAHGGTIEVDSSVGVGTTFTCRLPHLDLLTDVSA